jgi:hypothetical protein
MSHQRFSKNRDSKLCATSCGSDASADGTSATLQKHTAGLLSLHGETSVCGGGICRVRGDGETALGVADCAAEFMIVAHDLTCFNSLAEACDARVFAALDVERRRGGEGGGG